MENKKLNNIIIIKDERIDLLWSEEFENIYKQLSKNQYVSQISFLDLNKENELLNLSSGDKIIKVEEIKDSTVLLLTDGASNWGNFLMQDMLTQLSNSNMVSIINVMPEDNWRNLATGKTEVEAVINVNNKKNKELQTIYQWYHEDDNIDPKDRYLTMPMIYANEENINMLLNRFQQGGNVNSILIPTVEELINYIKHPRKLNVEYSGIKQSQTIEEIAANKLGAFRFMTSPEAYDLATFLSVVDSFTIEDMKLIQNEFFPEGKNNHIAEVYLGGILQSLDKEKIKDKNTKFIFQEGIAKELFKGLRISEEKKMLTFLPQLSIMKNRHDLAEQNKNKL